MPLHKTNKQGSGGKDLETFEGLTNNLWVGNLGNHITESDLMGLFSKYGALDSIISLSSKPYAFVYFNRVEDAKLARNALQGSLLHGCTIRIEFARTAKPSRNLWIGGITSTLSRDKVEEECHKYGAVEGFMFFRERNSAFVDFVRMEDASQAVVSMNGRRIGVDIIRVDFLRAHPSRLVSQLDQIPRERQMPWLPPDSPPSDAQPGYRRQQGFVGRKVEGQQSKVLWVGYPPSLQIDEQMLHNAMILFGEIERIKSFPSRHYSFVEFRSVEEARCAKEGLQGRLFNNPRISIMFSSSVFAPPKDAPGMFHGPRPDMLGPELLPFHPGPSDAFGHGHPMMPNASWRSSDAGWRRRSPPMQQLPPQHGGWDGPDPRSFREPKRFRMDPSAVHPMDELPPPVPYPRGDGFMPDGSPASSLANNHHHRPPLPVLRPGNDGDFVWRGVIAKGGTPVCRARCVPIGKSFDYGLPEVVNCSARTGLEMLAKHYTEAVGFDVAIFVPDSEDDFPSYTEFLRYLGTKDRSGVAKLDDGTTLFLVPPSDFLRKVLNSSVPERLYGVVLKLPQPIPPDDGHRAVDAAAVPTPQAAIALTPDLIATLASLMPKNVQPPAQQLQDPYHPHHAQFAAAPPPPNPFPYYDNNSNTAPIQQGVPDMVPVPALNNNGVSGGFAHHPLGMLAQRIAPPPPTAEKQGSEAPLPLNYDLTSNADDDKNQRYQSTLQLAASLLLQLQQQQQPQAGQATTAQWPASQQ